VSCARAKAEGGRSRCVGASYRGPACLCFYHGDMRNLAVIICNVVATPDYSRPQCNLSLYNFNITIYKAGGLGEAPFAILPPLGGLFVAGYPSHGVSKPNMNHSDRHARTVGSLWSMTTVDSVDQPPKCFIFCSVTPTLCAAVAAPLRKACEVLLKPSGGRSSIAAVTSVSQIEIEMEIEIVYNMYRIRRLTTITVCAGCCLWALPTMPYRKLTSQG
jgi:hypothetical protein